MSFVEAVKSALSKYATFSGRARRSEYWWFSLFAAVAYGVPYALGGALESQPLVMLGFLVALALVLPGIAVTVRRLHDTGRSGWWYLLAFVPFGGIVILVFSLMDSEPGDNAYGPNPKFVDAPAPVAPEAPVADVAAEPSA